MKISEPKNPLIPKSGAPLTKEQLEFLKAIAKSCRRTIIEMLKQSQSGHPGGSLSSIDYLTLLYSFILSQTGEKILVSNGHISPAVYGILAECGLIPKQQVIDTFRQVGSIYEGHVTRHVKGVFYGTGPLGIGVSAAAGFALAEKLKKSSAGDTENAEFVYALMGDGECQEGQVHEMAHFANKYHLNNLIVFVDYNEVQLSASLEEIMPINIPGMFKATGWNVLEIDGHNYQEMWKALEQAHKSKKKPTIIVAKTIMGKGVSYMEENGLAKKADWHGNAPKPAQADLALSELELSDAEKGFLEKLPNIGPWKVPEPSFIQSLSKTDLNPGTPFVYGADELTDCRSAYGKALQDLARHNPNIVALTADLGGSVKTDTMGKEFPDRHFDVGICEQNMVSVGGGMSLNGFIPFVSTFGAFMSSRAKDQARVNDINQTNVKMVATHCGLSVGEDGPTHQAIDDASSFLGMFNTMVIEPADPNQTDRIIRYIATHYGNFYVRMGRHKFPIITREDGTPFYDENYAYEYGRTDTIREGKDLTIVATGAMIHEALEALKQLHESHPALSIELIAATSIKKFDKNLEDSIHKTRRVLTVEDHNIIVGLSSQLAKHCIQQNLKLDTFENIAVREYQFSGKAEELYKHAGIDSTAIAKKCEEILM